jgi:sterol desaturase/sphingolipid hydroxylase (fatty acid hydroxylase superfamily)
MNIYHYITFGLFAAFALIDFVHGARSFSEMRFWRIGGVLAFFAYLAVGTYAPFLWDEALGAHRLFDLTAWPQWGQIALGFFILQAGIYAWHRTMHAVTPIWRFHQAHHTVERIDIWSTFYFHPVDMAGWALIGSLSLVWIVGISPEAALTIYLADTFCVMFQHANIRTPRWVGYIVTRPESHSMHHERGVHAYNYGDVPWFDMLFGTFRNPATFDGEVGFFTGASRRFWTLLTVQAIE